ncbi:hypothetical protein P7K49_017152 [Saguinus oedipus]|uniref:Uncharacterized protein n=1 Tax=Saguinus oedipus TaxID=9490 RepID=A0ABQ9V2D7_SAGOE|nr:hypothetical protein P7K49_017152 [Saguinus oedipus]
MGQSVIGNGGINHMPEIGPLSFNGHAGHKDEYTPVLDIMKFEDTKRTGKRDFEGFSLIGSKDWLKIVRRVDCLLFGTTIKARFKLMIIFFSSSMCVCSEVFGSVSCSQNTIYMNIFIFFSNVGQDDNGLLSYSGEKLNELKYEEN